MNFRVFKALATTFAYLGRHWPVLLKAMWLPALVITGLQLYAAPALFNGLAEIVLLGPNPAPEAAAAAFATLGGSLVWYVVAGLVFFPMLTVASLRHIISGEEPRAPFYLNFGADETRIMAGNFLFNLMLIVISIVGELVVGVIAAVFLLFGAGAAGAAKSLGGLGVNLLTAWFQVRMSTLFPAVIATKTLGLAAAFAATRRDWLALVFYWILVGLVVLPAIALFLMPMIGPAMGDIAAMRAGDAQAMAAFMQKLAASLDPKAASFWMIGAGVLVMTLFVNAVVNVASAVAWRHLTSAEERA